MGGSPRRAHVIAAKAGLVGLTRALACDFAADKINVNCLVPGLIDTPRDATAGGVPEYHARANTLLGRRGHPEEVASMVRFLCGPGARFVTGQTIHGNGGVFCLEPYPHGAHGRRRASHARSAAPGASAIERS